jgi:phosphate:Na+ symporter
VALWASPILIFAGYIIFSVARETRPHNIGRIMIGLGLMLLSLKLISVATAPLREASLFHDLLAAVGHEPLLAFFLGAIMAWGFHSTLAVILLIASFLANGSLDVAGALGFVLGLNFGGGLPAISATLALPVEGRRLPLANLICRGTAAILGLAFLQQIAEMASASPFSSLNTVLGLHVLFNSVVALAFLPLTRPIDRLTRRLLPAGPTENQRLHAPRYLDGQSLATPPIALSNAVLETMRMSEILENMFDTALAALNEKNQEALKLLKPLDQKLALFQSEIQAYLVELSQARLDLADERKALEITLYVSNLKHAADVVSLNLAERIKTIGKQSIRFSADEYKTLNDLAGIVRANMKLASAVLAAGDVEGARRLIAQKDTFRDMENRVFDTHYRSGTRRKRQDFVNSALFVAMVRDLHRINSHIVSAGYPIVEAAGLLRGTRLRKEAKPAG